MRLLITLSLTFCWQLHAMAQNSWPNDSAFWKFHGSTLIVGTPISDYFIFELNGDTLIGGQTYSKIYKTAENFNPLDNLHPYTYFPRIFYGGIREDDKVVYFYGPSQGESLVFDFKHIVGDTVATVDYFGNPVKVTVLSIDSVQMLDGSYRRRFNFWPDFGAPYIEGIGTQDIFPIYYAMGGPGSTNWQLTCFMDYGNLLYYESATEECSLITSANEIDVSNNRLEVFPNPFSDECRISFGSTIHNAHIRVIDPLGRTVINKEVSQASSLNISGDELKSYGCYLVVLDQEDISVTAKIVFGR